MIQADGLAKIYPVQAHVQWKEVPILPPLMGRNTPSMETATMCWPRYCVLEGFSLVNTSVFVLICNSYELLFYPSLWDEGSRNAKSCTGKFRMGCNSPRKELGTYCNGWLT